MKKNNIKILIGVILLLVFISAFALYKNNQKDLNGKKIVSVECPKVTKPEGPYKGNWPADTLEEAKKNHLVGVIPTEKILTRDTMIDDGKAKKSFLAMSSGFREKGCGGWTPEFMALNILIEEQKIAAYEWDYSSLTIYYNSGRSSSILFSSDQRENNNNSYFGY